ncbi:MAG: FMN-binding protein [Nocardioides sp.]
MRRIVLWAMSTLTLLVLLFSYHTSRGASTTVASSIEQLNDSASSTDTGSSGASSTDASGSSGSSSSSPSTTYAGDAVQTQFGPVQVQITVSGGTITKAEVLQVPWGNGRDQEINSRAVPILNSEVVQTQSARIDMVSGASITSNGYLTSLQSAIDQANL